MPNKKTSDVSEKPIVANSVPNGLQLGLPKFKQRLRDARTNAGLSMSELARRIWGATTDARGYPVARNRDRISKWEAGDQIPSAENLAILAKELGMTIEELAPDLVASNVSNTSDEDTAIGMTMVQGYPDRVHLRVNTLTTLALASKVITMLSDEQVAAGPKPTEG